MIEQGVSFYYYIIMLTLALAALSWVLPFYGFIKKRWKGLGIGCLLQPVAVFILCLLLYGSAYLFQKYDLDKQRSDAMVVVKKADGEEGTKTWYLKSNDECFFEYKNNDGKSNLKAYGNVRLFDVVPVDSTSVCVDDHITVRFDVGKRKVTALEYEEPIEVVSVDWDKVKEYLQKQH